MRVTEIKETFHPEELIEIHGTGPFEDFFNEIGPYLELSDKRNAFKTWYDGLGTLIFLTYLIYHVISKIRGNEKNVQLNNYGICLSLLGLVNFSIFFTKSGTDTLADDKNASWRDKHETLYKWMVWSSNSAYFLYHWLFNWRYIKSTFRLPALQKGAEFHSEMLDRVIAQREDQHVLFSPQELEDFAREMG